MRPRHLVSRLAASILAFCWNALPAAAGMDPHPMENGLNGLALSLRPLGRFETVMTITAHPDDEDNALLAEWARVQGVRAVLYTITRGEGGQNRIGPERGDALAALRTEELLSMHRLDGAEQLCGNAIDFGYSFSLEETLEKWGRDETLEEIVRAIRTVCPDIIVTLSWRGGGGGQHHQASGLLTREAFFAAAGPDRFPGHLEEGLHPWTAKKLYTRVLPWIAPPPGSENAVLEIPVGGYDPLLGMSPHQLGMMARSFHFCQEMNQPLALPGERASRLLLEESAVTADLPERGLFDGLADPLSNPGIPESIRSGLREIAESAYEARRALDIHRPEGVLEPLLQGLDAVRETMDELERGTMPGDVRQGWLVRLRHQEQRWREAVIKALALSFDPVADVGAVAPGGTVQMRLHAANRGAAAIEDAELDWVLPKGWSVRGGPPHPATMAGGETMERNAEITVPPGAEPTWVHWENHPTLERRVQRDGEPFGLPFRPPPVTARFAFTVDGRRIEWIKPAEFRYDDPFNVGIKQKEITVLPRLSVSVSPDVLAFPMRNADKRRTATVSVAHCGAEPAAARVRLEAPAGWLVRPKTADIELKPGETATVAFSVEPPEVAGEGVFEIAAAAETAGGRRYASGAVAVEYVHIQKRYVRKAAKIRALALGIEAPAARVGYIMGVGDEVPAALRQLGAEADLLDETALMRGDLSRYDLIMTGVRAYLNREDLRRHNQRLLEYVHNGGTLFVQYNKYEFNEGDWAPYPARVGRGRVTDENAPVRALIPAHSLFNIPNRLDGSVWEGWVQERGIYFLDERDGRYADLIASEDPFESNAGEKRGVLVEARYGKGRWLYCGLALFRQLSAGVPGAYELLANLLGLAANGN